MVTKNQLMGIAIAALVATAIVLAAIVYYELRIKGTGRIKLIGVKAYSDADLTKEVSSIDWGLIPRGGSSQITLWLKSTSSCPANLTLRTENWVPPNASDYLTLNWDYDGSPLYGGEVREVLFTLGVAQNVFGITDFSFDMIITIYG